MESSVTLRTSALAICYSTAAYACPVWWRTNMHQTSWITGCLTAAPLNELFILYIPDISRNDGCCKQYDKVSYDLI